MRASSVSIPAATALLLAATAPAALAASTTERISVSSTGQQANGSSDDIAISSDARFVAFDSVASNLVAGDTNGAADVFVRDRQNGTTERVSVSSLGEQGNDFSFGPAISADGHFVAFSSRATNLVPGDTNGGACLDLPCSDVFVRDRQNGTTERVSVSSGGEQGNDESRVQAISRNGRYVSFYSSATNLVPGDTNGSYDVFVRDRVLGTTKRVSVGSGGTECDGWSFGGPMSADGRFVIFTSFCADLAPGGTNGHWGQVFIHDLQTGYTELVSVNWMGVQSNDSSGGAAISPDGRYVSFYSDATNLVPGDTNRSGDGFIRDRLIKKTERVTVSSGNRQTDGGSAWQMSADGRFVVLESDHSNLVPGDTNGTFDVFVRDRLINKTERVDVSSDGQQSNDGGDGGSVFSTISADSGIVVFESDATNLVPGDTNGADDIFVHIR